MKTDKVVALILDNLREALAAPERLEAAAAAANKALPAEQVENIKAILCNSAISYRDALIVQFAFGLAAKGPLDLTLRQPGARGDSGVAGRLSAFLTESHIKGVKDAFQNVGKNTANLARGNFPQFDAALKWASTAGRKKLRAAFAYACAVVASTSRPVLRMPELRVSALTFANVIALIDGMFAEPSQGAYQQFTIAALLHALIQQVGAQAYRVETKSLNASDRSSRTAGDVQILTGNRVVEAYEVTANEWLTKINQAEQTIKDNDLSRLHIVADAGSSRVDIIQRLRTLQADVSVLDVRGFASVLVSALTRQHRAIALARLYEFLDRYQPDVDRVNAYVKLLEQEGLTNRG